jgi:hypothetical protein
MQNFRLSSPYAYRESPYAYGDWFVMCQQSFLQSRVEAEFCARTCAHSHQKTLLYCIILIALHSPFACRDISQLLSICGIASVQFYHFTLLDMKPQAPALPELVGVLALPPVPQEAPKDHPTKQEGAVLDIWIIEGTDNLDDAGIRHKNAFYALLKEWFRGRDYTCTLLTKRKYDEILKFCLDLINSADCCSLYIAGNKQAYKWAVKYNAIVVGEESTVLVLRPTKGPIADPQSTCLDALQQPTHFERLFLDLLKIHHVDHCKGNTFWKRAKQAHENVPREFHKMFSNEEAGGWNQEHCHRRVWCTRSGRHD